MRTVGGMLKGKECLFRRLKQFKTAFCQGIGNGIVIPAVQKINGDLRPDYLPAQVGDQDGLPERMRPRGGLAPPQIELLLQGVFLKGKGRYKHPADHRTHRPRGADADPVHGLVAHPQVSGRNMICNRTGFEPPDHAAVPGQPVTVEHILVSQPLGMQLIRHLSDADVGMIQLRKPRRRLNAEKGAARTPQQVDLLLTETPAQVVGQLPGVGDQLLRGNGLRARAGVVRQAGPPLLPPYHGKILLQHYGIARGKEVIGHAPVQVKQHGIVPAFAPDKHPLLYPADLQEYLFGDAPREGLPVLILQGRRLPRTVKQQQQKQQQHTAGNKGKQYKDHFLQLLDKVAHTGQSYKDAGRPGPALQT